MLTQSSSTSKQKDDFAEELCLALISADIPFFKLKNPVFNEFLSKYTNRNILDESTLRKNYLDICYQKTMQKLLEVIGDSYVYLVVDETTDIRGNFVANLLIGKLSSCEAGYPFLLASKVLDKTNHDTICRFINTALKIFPNDSGIEDRVLLLLTDAASYMLKAGKSLKTFYKNVIHVTCMAHALNLIAEKVRDSFPELNSLVNQGKKIFLKAPSRVVVYKELMEVALPPTPVLTRWGTWLSAALFYAEHWNKYTEVIRKLEKNEADCAQSLDKVAKLIENVELRKSLTFVKTHCAFLVESLKKLEKQGMPLYESISIIEEAEMNIDSIPGVVGKLLKTKKDAVLEKNQGFRKLRSINQIFLGNGDDKTINEDSWDPQLLSSFKFAPITSVDVERSFSTYKSILSDRRHNLTEDNLEKYLFVNLNYSKLH